MNQSTQAKYTPGPWKVTTSRSTGSGLIWIYQEAHGGGCQKTVYDAEAPDVFPLSPGDALALSLTPRMVNTLRAALPMLEELETWEWGNGGAEVLPEAEEVRAILREIDEED